jgi:hypothetical protein
MHLGTLAQGMEQCRVVMRAQIAPEPHQSAGKG